MKAVLKKGRIQRILAKENCSQNWFAERVGTTSGYMSQMMCGVRNPSAKMRKKILKVLKGYQFDDLFTLQIACRSLEVPKPDPNHSGRVGDSVP